MSDIIQLLPDAVANQIAAGEVIQRPASVVKELVENALDAGATEITINIKDAGKTLIQISDNGCGMSPTDARMAFERHATSKIKNANDLFCIRTMGFRGEALASIAAIADVELRTKKVEDELGTVYPYYWFRSKNPGTGRRKQWHKFSDQKPVFQCSGPPEIFESQFNRIKAYYLGSSAGGAAQSRNPLFAHPQRNTGLRTPGGQLPQADRGCVWEKSGAKPGEC